MFGGVRQEFRKPSAGLAVLGPLPGAGHQFVFAMLEDAADLVLLRFDRFGDRFAIEFDQLRFVIDQVEGRRASVLEEEDHLFGGGGEVWGADRQRVERVDRQWRWGRT